MRETGAGDQLLRLAQVQWADLVHVPVGSTDIGLGLSTTAGAHIDESQKAAIVAPAEANGSTGFDQSSLDHQRLFGNANFIHELALRAEQIAAGSRSATNQFWADREASPSTDSHTIEPQLNSGLAVLNMKRSGR